MNILVATLGQSWEIIPELLAFIQPQQVPLFRNHPRAESLKALRTRHELQPVDEIWLCGTDDSLLRENLGKLKTWRQRAVPELTLRTWLLEGVTDIIDEDSAAHMRELIFRLVLKARADGVNRVYLSLAGGRKTMSSDMQEAAGLFGCDALLHMLLEGPPVRFDDEELFSVLPGCKAGAFTPIVMSATPTNELITIATEQEPAIDSRTYPLPEAGPDAEQRWRPEQCELNAAIEHRRKERTRLWGNFMHALNKQEPQSNWRSLYRLPPEEIDYLRKTPLDDAHRDWLIKLPKADLHRHIGGCLSIDQQIEVARAIWEATDEAGRRAARAVVEPLLEKDEWPWNWPEQLKKDAAPDTRAQRSAALLLYAGTERLQHNLYGVTEPRRALQQSEKGFAAYERPGELSGSALLGHPAALAPYVQALVRNAREEGLCYLELRGSPQKYRQDSESQFQFLQQIRELCQQQDAVRVRFIVIIDRRQLEPTQTEAAVRLAVRAHQKLDRFVVGIDIAGDEKGDDPAALRCMAAALQPAFQACMPVTIHAGEGTEPEKIWNAAYHLHADRIGHGLTLRGCSELMERFRDRRICIEMCPASNDEVVGFSSGDYPLLRYYDESLPICLCTDNPAISRTTAADEYLRVGAMTGRSLTLWQTLALVKNGFRHSFLPSGERRALLQETDRLVYDAVLELLE